MLHNALILPLPLVPLSMNIQSDQIPMPPQILIFISQAAKHAIIMI